MEHARRGANALAGGNPSLAIEHYTKAIHELPNAVDYYIQRSSAYHRLASHESALQDANKAVLLAQQRGKREFVAKAQLRRGIALFGMEKYGDAQVVLGFAKKLDEKEKTVPIWEMKVKQALDKLPTDDLRRKATVTEIPSVPTEPSVQSCTKQMHEVSAHEKQSGAEPRKSEEVESKTTSSYSQSKPSKISARYDWYQSSGIVSMSIFASGVKEENCSVQLAERLVSVSIALPTGSTWDLTLDPLYAPIVVDESSFKLIKLPGKQDIKIEIKLKKSIENQKWPALEGPEPAQDRAISPQSSAPNVLVAVNKPTIPAKPPSQPAYPTSSRSGPKNWDKIADDLLVCSKPNKKSKKDDDVGSEPDDMAADDDEGGDPADMFFKQLYRNADPDTRRAMMKSYTESNGTALSTNWEEVSKKTFPVEPPDGMEARKW